MFGTLKFERSVSECRSTSVRSLQQNGVRIQMNSSVNENFSSSSVQAGETSLMIKLWFIKQTKFILQILVCKQTNSRLCKREAFIVQTQVTIKAGAQSERALTWISGGDSQAVNSRFWVSGYESKTVIRGGRFMVPMNSKFERSRPKCSVIFRRHRSVFSFSVSSQCVLSLHLGHFEQPNGKLFTNGKILTGAWSTLRALDDRTASLKL